MFKEIETEARLTCLECLLYIFLEDLTGITSAPVLHQPFGVVVDGDVGHVQWCWEVEVVLFDVP